MGIPVNPNLKGDAWAKHKAALASVPGAAAIGDKIKVLEAAAGAAGNDPASLQKLDAAINGLMSVAGPAVSKVKAAKGVPPASMKYVQDMINAATALRKDVATKEEAAAKAAASPSPAPTRSGGAPAAPPKPPKPARAEKEEATPAPGKAPAAKPPAGPASPSPARSGGGSAAPAKSASAPPAAPPGGGSSKAPAGTAKPPSAASGGGGSGPAAPPRPGR